jgi:hypothetical protein
MWMNLDHIDTGPEATSQDFVQIVDFNLEM